MLEFGGGPTIYPLISAAPFVSEIIFSDYAEANRKEVTMWKNKEPKVRDWSNRFQYAMTELEGNDDPKAVEKRQDEVRRKIKDIIPCDLREDDVLLGAATGPFDIISTTLCIESVSQSLEEYRANLKKMYDLLKPGGFLLSFLDEECSGYSVGGESYHYLYLTKDDVINSFKSKEFAVKETFQRAVKEVEENRPNPASVMKALLFVAGQKLK